MKERPIIFSTESVRAILEGRKTQTRRVIKLKNYHRNIWDYCVPHNGEQSVFRSSETGQLVPYLKVPYDEITDNAGCRIFCPYGQVGDRLWVRETWASENRYNHLKPSEIPQTAKIFYLASVDYDPFEMGKVRSSRFMPRWASRILLEITAESVARLRDISLEDIELEGTPMNPMRQLVYTNDGYQRTKDWIYHWDKVIGNAKRGYGWETNPWVWVISFERVK